MYRRRILMIALAAIVLAGLLWLGSWLLGKVSQSEEDAAGNLPEIGGSFDPENAEIPEALSDSLVAVAGVDAYFAKPDGTLVTIGRDGVVNLISASSTQTLSSKAIDNFASASFSYDGKRILVVTGNQPRVQANIFDVEAASWRVIPGTFRDIAWSPADYRLATLAPDPETGKTAVVLYDTTLGKSVKTLASLAVGEMSVSWPTKNAIILEDKPNRYSAGSSWRVDATTGAVSIAARGKLGHVTYWSPLADVALAFEANPYSSGGRNKIYINSVPQAALSFTTLPSKCTFAPLGSGSSTTPFIICGVPRDQNQFQQFDLPDAYYRKELVTDDVLVGVNLERQTVDFVLSPPTPVDISQIRVAGSTAYYLNRADGALYKTSL